MPLPVGIETRTVTISTPYDLVGGEARYVSGKVYPDRTLVWEATGEVIWPIPASLPAPVDGVISFDVPIVDQPGFVDAAGNPVEDFSYRISLRATWPGSTRRITKSFQIFDADPDPVDLDVYPDDGAGAPPVLVAPYVGTVAGLSGGVSGADLVTAIEQELRKKAGLLAVARDESDTEWPFPIGAFGAVMSGMSVTIPPVTRPVRLEYQAYGKITQVGVGIFGYTIYETTSGAGVDVGGNTISLIDKAGVFESLRHFAGSVEIAPLAVPAWRTFRLMGGLFIQSGATGTAVSSKSGATKSRSAHLTAVQL